MSSKGNLSEFNQNTGQWSTYIERMEQYFTANAITPELQVPTLIAHVGDATYELMVDLCNPKKPKDVKYEELVEIIRNHLQPTPSILAERFKFRKRFQAPNESVAQFAVALKHLARTCQFKTTLDENLRDQFVCGLLSEATRQRLFCDDDQTYAKAYKRAVSLEAAARSAATVEFQPAENREYSVHAVQTRYGAQSRRGGWRGSTAAGTNLGRGGAGAGATSSAARSNYTTNSSIVCTCCGERGHYKNNCRFNGYVCKMCLKPGHLKRVCPNARQQRGEGRVMRLDTTQEEVAEEEWPVESDGEGDGPSGLYMVELSGSEPVVADVEVAGYMVRMHVDTGSPISCVSEVFYNQKLKNYPINQDSLKLKGYDGQPIKSLGYVLVEVRFGKLSGNYKLYIIQNGGVPLLGREWLKQLNMDIKVINFAETGTSENVLYNKQDFINRFPRVFSNKLGKLRSQQARLVVRRDAVPVYRRARPLPLALRPAVDAELRRMEDIGIISPITSSEWASCIVVVVKSNGSLRICGDYKSTVNPVLEVDRYPLPRAEYLFDKLSGGKKFSKIDLSEAYAQICLDESKKYTVVNTHRGLYVYNRLVYGLSSAPAIFQRIIEQIMVGIPGVTSFLDDILVTGSTETEHISNLSLVLERLDKEGLTVRKEKCTFFAPEVSYLGFIVSEHGIRTDPKKVEAVTHAPPPTTVTELKSFIGMINFCSKFIKDYSKILQPLFDLLKKDTEWYWGEAQKQSFEQIKSALVSSPVLAHYSDSQELILTCDASARGVGAVLTHRTEQGERPVSYASRTLTAAETNYSQIQREALAIVFGVKKFHTYLYGRKFILRTDHQPLVTIFGSKKDLPHTAAGRLIRWAILLSGYRYEIEGVRSASNVADALSRLPIDNKEQIKAGDEVFIKFVENNFPLQASEVKKASSRDICISKAISYVKSGWPESSSIASADTELSAYYKRRDELSVEGGCLMWGCRVVIPTMIRAQMLDEIHGSHLGIVKCKGLARSYVWWPGIDHDIEQLCASCRICAETADMPPRSQVVPWPWPTRPFDRVHIDFFTYKTNTYMVVVDSHSKWLEVVLMSTTTASNTIHKLKEIFARFGLPRKLISDNGPPFTSEEFVSFLKKNGIKQVTSAPYHPASNGEAENNVRLIKRAFRKADADRVPLNIYLQRFLLDYRNSVHGTTGESPAMLMFGRQLRSRLDLIKNDISETVTERLNNNAARKSNISRQFKQGDQVWARDFRLNNKWIKTKIICKKGYNVYEVQTDEGLKWCRHVDQLRCCSEPVTPSAPPAQVSPPPAARPLPQRTADTMVTGISDNKPNIRPVVSQAAAFKVGEQPQTPKKLVLERGQRVRRPVLRYGRDY